jgi:hypothetical protein
MIVVSMQRHCRLKHSGDVRVVIGLKEGGTVEERFMIDDGNADVDTASTPSGRPEGPGNCLISDTWYIEGILTLDDSNLLHFHIMLYGKFFTNISEA